MKLFEGDFKSFFENVKQDSFYAVEITEWKGKRSLHANNLFHLLVGKIAKAHNPPLSFDRCKNILIGRYGMPETIDGVPVTIKTQISPELMLERHDIHCKLLKGGDGNTFFYWVMKHTADYNTAEFATLLDGTIEDCRDMGIQVVTEEEKKRALALWGLKIGETNDKKRINE